MNILVTGGAGYIGAHCCKELAARGFQPVVFDDLSKGHRENIRWGGFHQGSTGSLDDLTECLRRWRIEAVMHFAAFIEVGESVADPAAYYRNNVGGSLNLLHAMVQQGIRHLVFSSSAAVYGNPVRVPIDEEHPRAPLSPYGWSKQMVETMLADFDTAWGLRAMALRYFNAAGADRQARLGQDYRQPTHLLTRALKTALGLYPKLEVFGSDYPTPDGTAIRDYIHVDDLAGAHMLALEFLKAEKRSRAFNCGYGIGHSVLDVIAAAKRVTDIDFPVALAARRPGDPAALVADAGLIRRELGWNPEVPRLDEIVASAWNWEKKLAAAKKP